MTENKNKRFRIAAALTAVIFGMTNTTLAQTPVPISLDQGSGVGIVLPADFNIPETLGSIQARFSDNVPGKPFVIVVQDAHGIVDAQNNIQKIIAHLQASYGLNLIAIEGGDGRLDPTLFRTFPDEFVKKKIMDGYLRRGELTGSEMAAIFNPGEGVYYGIEDWNLYEENYFAYLRAIQKKEKILEGLKVVRESFDKERLKVYSPKLNEFHEQTAKFETENTYLPQLLKFLGAFEGTRERLAQYPEIEKLFQSLEFEAESSEKQGDLDAPIRQMAEAFKTKYLSRMTTEQVKAFHKHHQDFLTAQSEPAHFLQYLVKTGESFGLKAKLTPSLVRLLGHSQTLAAIKGTRLFDELEDLLNEVENALITTPEERELSKKYRQLNLSKDLASLELTRNQWEELQALSDKRSAVRKETANSFSLTADFQPALEFYRLALERDKAFRKNLAGLLKKEKSKTALVLAGGFHSQGLEQSLKEEGFSYAVVTPKIQSLEGQDTYADVMQGKGISYRPYLKTTFYDAFVKDASIKLASEFNEPEFRQKIRAWRDGVIRQLAKEGRIAEAKEYTRYIDLVWKVYYDKFANENFRPNARQEILRAIEKELENFRHDFLENLRPQMGSPQALQTHAVMNLTRKSTPELMRVVRNLSELLPLARSELRASSDIRATVTALINTVFQNSSGAEVLNGKFAGFSQALLQGQDAASRQTRVNFVNFYNTLLRSLRQGSVNRRQFFDILNQVFSFTPGTASGNLDSVLTRTQTIERNGRQVYTLDTFYNSLAQTLLDYGLKTPAGWSNPYQTGLNESGEQRNQFGKLNQYFSAGLPAREVLRILADVKAAPRESRIETFEEKLAEMQRRFETAPTQINNRLGETQVPDSRATILRQGGATMRIAGAVTNTGNSAPTMAPQVQDTIRPRSQATVSDIPPVMRQVYEKLNLRIPANFEEPEDSIFSRVIPTTDSLFETPSEARRRQEQNRLFRAEAQAARDEVLEELNRAPDQAKQRARSEVRAAVAVGEQIAGVIWDELTSQWSQTYTEYIAANKGSFAALFRQKANTLSVANIPSPVERIKLSMKDIKKATVRRIDVSDENAQRTLGVQAVYIVFDETDTPRAAAVFRPRNPQPVLRFLFAKSDIKPAAPAVEASGTVTLTDWVLERLEESDERVEIYRQGHYQVENSTELLEIETENPLYAQVTELFNRMAQPPGGEVISVITVEPGISRENLEAALARLSQDTTDYENNQFAIRHSETTLADLRGIQSQKDPKQTVEQRILNNVFSSLPEAEIAQEMDSQSFLRRLVLSIGLPDTQTTSEFSSKSIDHALNDVFVTGLASRNILDNLPSGKAKGKMQEQAVRLFTTPVGQLHKLDFKGSTWGQEGILDFRLLGAKGFRGYYLAFGNQIVVFAVLPARWTHSEAGKKDVLTLAKAENAKREARRKEKKALFTAEEREASLKFFETDLKLEITSQAERVAAAQNARDETLAKLNTPGSREPASRRRSEVRATEEQISASARAVLEEQAVPGHILGEPDEEGWLVSDDEERLFELVVTSRKIRDIYEKLEQEQTVTPEDLKLVLQWLKLGNPLAMILGERLQGGDWVVNWQVSGVGEGKEEGGLGVKQFNNPELLGEQGYNDFKFKTLVRIIAEEMERVFTEKFGKIPTGPTDPRYTRGLYYDFKGDLQIGKSEVSVKLKGISDKDFKDLLRAVEPSIKKQATEELKKLLIGKEEILSKYGIDRESAVNLLAIKVGFSQVKKFSAEDKPELKAKARLEAVIHSTFARELPDGAYNQDNYKDFIRDTIDLRDSLDREGTLKNLFTDYTLEYTDSRGEKQKHGDRVIRDEYGIHLRKKTAWEKLPYEAKKAFKNEEFYKQAQAFFNRLSVQDYFIRWPLEFDKAAGEANKILKVIQYLYQNLKNNVGITKRNRQIIKDIIQRYILADARNRGITSPIDFHGLSPPMKGTPVYVFMDVIGLGAELGRVLTAQIGLINKLIQEEKWDEVGAVQRHSGADIIDKKLKMQKAIQDTYEKVLEEEAQARPLLMHVGGDEVVLVFNTKGLSPALLNILWFEIRRAVSDIGFQIRMGIEADASQYREGYGEDIKNADNFAHMGALKTSDRLTEILGGLEDGVKDGRLGPEFVNDLVIHQNGEFVIRVETKEGIRDYTQPEVQAILAGGQALADFNAAQAAAVENLTTDEKVREVADPVASALTHAVLNAGATTPRVERLAANEILAQALAVAVTAKPLNPEASQKLGKLIAQVLSNRDEKQHLGKLIAALFMKSGKYPVPENVKEVRTVMQAAIENAFEVRSLFSAEEMEEGRKKYGDQAVELKAFLAKGWERNRSVMDNAAVSNWYLAINLMEMKRQPQLRIAAPKIVPQAAASPASSPAPAARSELRRIIRGSEEMMKRFRGQPVKEIVQTVFASEFYNQTGQLIGLGESPKTVLLVDSIRGTVVWELAKFTGGVAPGEAAFEPSAGYKSITPQFLFLLDHPDLLQKMLAKSNPSADIWGRGLRLYDGALIAPIEDIARHKEDKEHIQRQLEWTTVVIAFQVGTEKKIIDILRIPGVIPLALKDDTGDLAKVGGHFEDIRMTLASGTRIKSGRIREGAAAIVYYNRLAAYLRQSNLSLARLARLSDLALSSEEIKSKMLFQDGAHVMTPEAFNMVVDFVERLALDQEVQTTYETAA